MLFPSLLWGNPASNLAGSQCWPSRPKRNSYKMFYLGAVGGGWGLERTCVGFTKDKLKYEDITPVLPSRSENVPGLHVKKYSSPPAWIKEHTAEIVGGWRQKFWASVLRFSLKVETVSLEGSTWHGPCRNQCFCCASRNAQEIPQKLPLFERLQDSPPPPAFSFLLSLYLSALLCPKYIHPPSIKHLFSQPLSRQGTSGSLHAYSSGGGGGGGWASQSFFFASVLANYSKNVTHLL